MASGVWSLKGKRVYKEETFRDLTVEEILAILIPDPIIEEEQLMSTNDENKDDTYINTPDAGDDFDFVMAYDDDPAEADERLLPDNAARSAISCSGH